MKYETIPTEVEVIEFVVDGGIVGADGKMIPAKKGQFGVRWPNSGIAEVLSPDDFHKKFRVPPPPYVDIRDPLRPLVDRDWPHDRPKITWTDPAMPIGPTCGAPPCSP